MTRVLLSFRSTVLHACFLSIMLAGSAYSAETPQPELSSISAGQTLLDRPLFEPDRRPKGVPAKEKGGFRLAGIAGRPGHWVSIFRRNAPDAKSDIRRPGEKIDDWTVSSISQTSVTLTRDTETRELKPSFLFEPPPVIKPKPALSPEVKLMASKRIDPHLAW